MLKRLSALFLIGAALVVGLPTQGALAAPSAAAADQASTAYNLNSPTADTDHGRAFH